MYVRTYVTGVLRSLCTFIYLFSYMCALILQNDIMTCTHTNRTVLSIVPNVLMKQAVMLCYIAATARFAVLS